MKMQNALEWVSPNILLNGKNKMWEKWNNFITNLKTKGGLFRGIILWSIIIVFLPFLLARKLFEGENKTECK